MEVRTGCTGPFVVADKAEWSLACNPTVHDTTARVNIWLRYRPSTSSTFPTTADWKSRTEIDDSAHRAFSVRTNKARRRHVQRYMLVEAASLLVHVTDARRWIHAYPASFEHTYESTGPGCHHHSFRLCLRGTTPRASGRPCSNSPPTGA